MTLVFPRFKYISGDPPLGIAYIAAYLKERLPDVEVSIIDTTFTRSLEVVRKNLDDISPDIVGIYLDTIMYRDGIRIARMAREKGAFVVAGGPHATMAHESVIKLKEATFSITTPIPGTYLYDMVKKRGMHISDDFSDFDYYSKRAFSGDNLILNRLKTLQKKALFSFYMHPFRWGYIARHIISPNGIKRLIRKVRRFV